MNTSQRFSTRRIDARSEELQNNVRYVLSLLWARKWRIFGYMWAAIALCILYLVYVAVPKFSATAVVALQDRNANYANLNNVVRGLGGDIATVNTEVEILRARGIIGKLVDELDLMSDPEFNGALREPSWLSLQIAAGREAAFGPPEPREALPSGVRRDAVINLVQSKVRITNPRFSRIFQITIETEDPDKSQQMADKLADLYILDQLEIKFKATERATAWLTERVAELKSELEDAQNAVKTFNSNAQLISPEALEAQNRQVKDFRDRIASQEEQQTGLAARLASLESAAQSNDPDRMAAAADDVGLNQLVRRLAGGGDVARQGFDNRFNQILQQALVAVERGTTQMTALRETVKDLEDRVARQSTDLLKLEQLQREAEASGLIYESFLNQLKETEVQVGIQTSDSRLISRAARPIAPSKPRKGLLVIVSAFMGIMVGAGLVLFRELSQTNFRSSDDLEAATGLQVIGRAPKAPTTRRRRLLKYIATKPNSALSESVRNLRTSILLSNVDKPPQVVMIASTVPGEGKTTLALTLSQSLAGLNKRVLLMEGDIRRHTLREYFKTPSSGLIGVVAGDTPLDDVVYHSDQLGIDVLTAERSGVMATDFFSSERFSTFMEEVRRRYDMIVIDTPPVMVVPDARVIGQHVDSVIYAVHWGRTPRTMVIQGLDAFESVNIKVSGMVLSQIDPREAERYGENYSSYGGKYYLG